MKSDRYAVRRLRSVRPKASPKLDAGHQLLQEFTVLYATFKISSIESLRNCLRVEKSAFGNLA